MGFGWQEIDKTLDLGYIRVAGLHRECKPAVLFEPPNFRPRTMTHKYIRTRKYLALTHVVQYYSIMHPQASYYICMQAYKDAYCMDMEMYVCTYSMCVQLLCAMYMCCMYPSIQ